MKFFILSLAAVLITENCWSQQLNVYNRLVDPIAIARLDLPDFGPIRLNYGYGYGLPDPEAPGYYIYAQDSGKGVITHLYVTSRTPDSLTDFKLFVDGELLRKGSMQSFFTVPLGYLRAPLDTLIGEARFSDVQIPYHTSFRLEYKSSDFSNWFDYAWRPLPAQSELPASDLNSKELATTEAIAVNTYNQPSSIWNGWHLTDSTLIFSLAPDRSRSLFLTGPAVVAQIHLKVDRYDSTLDSTWIDIYYDGSSTPAFQAPLLALFGQSFDFRPLHSFPIDFSRDSGFTMRLPMPFAHSARFIVRNQSKANHSLQLTVSFARLSVDTRSMGYLHSRFCETAHAPYHIPHPVLHRKGRGRYVGILMGIPNLSAIQTYEGDAMFVVDSDQKYSFHYEGTEDYFNGAQYFSCGEFESPFGGTQNLLSSYYRFHYLDAMDFRSSFDFDFQHGNDDDCSEHYRTLAFWYEQQVPYSATQDTIRPEQLWDIAGASYRPYEKINIMLDSTIIDSSFAELDGSFNRSIVVPNFKSGFYQLTVNDVVYPEFIYLSEAPTIQILNQPKPLLSQPGDTIYLSGSGYTKGDTLIALIGGIFCRTNLLVDEFHRLHGWVIIPDVESRTLGITIYGLRSGQAQSSEKLHIHRTLKFECEQLNADPPILSGGYFNMCGYISYNWSQNAVYEFRPTAPNSEFNLDFNIPFSDYFALSAILEQARSFGNYDIFVDNGLVGHFHGYRDTSVEASPTDSIGLGTVHLLRGRHQITFKYTGKDGSATDSLLWADYLVLEPLSGITSTDSSKSLMSNILVYPSPAAQVINLRLSPSINTLEISIVDLLGRLQLHEVRQGGPEDIQIPVSNLPSGEYLVRFNFNDKLQSKLVVIRH